MMLLSIITINYNNATGLINTARSVRGLPNWCEWIVIDGGSSDGSIRELECSGVNPSIVVSEPDTGIASAFNKGIRRSSGRYILFLNSGDCLIEHVLHDLYSIVKNKDAPLFVGKINIEGRSIGSKVKFWRQFLRNHLPHQGMIIRRSLFRMVGNFDESFCLGMDYEWSLRLKSIWSKIQFVDYTISNMEKDGRSITNYRDTYDMYHHARVRHCRFAVISKIISECYKVKVFIGLQYRRIRETGILP